MPNITTKLLLRREVPPLGIWSPSPAVGTDPRPVINRNARQVERIHDTNPMETGRSAQAKKKLDAVMSPFFKERQARVYKTESISQTRKSNPRLAINLRTVPKSIKVTIKDSKLKNTKKRIITVNEEIALAKGHCKRSEFTLPIIDPNIIKKAQQLKSCVAETQRPKESYDQAYQRVLQEAVTAQRPSFRKADLRSAELYDLTTLIATKSETRPNAPNQAFPRGFLDPASSKIIPRLRTIIRYILQEENHCKSAPNIEKIKGWEDLLKKSGCGFFFRSLTVPGMLNIAYPGWTMGDYPPIRMHELDYQVKYKGDGISPYALIRARRVFLEQKIYDNNGRLDKSKITKIKWSPLFVSEKYDFGATLRVVGSTLALLELALPELIGVEPGQIKPWEFDSLVRWSKDGESGYPRIKQLTQCVLASNDCLDDKHEPDVAKIRKITNWHQRFEQEATSALNRAGVTNVYEAIKITYPASCGWQHYQINPGDIRSESMWTGVEGKELFSKRFAKALFEIFGALKKAKAPGFNKTSILFDPDSKPPIIMNREELRLLVSYMTSNQINWSDIFSYFGLRSPFDSICGGNTQTAFKVLLQPTSNRLSKQMLQIQPEDLQKAGPRASSLKQLLNKELEGLSSISEPLLFRSIYLTGKSPEKALHRFLQPLIRPQYTSPLRIARLCNEAYCVNNISKHSEYQALEHVLETKRDGEFIFNDRNIGALLKLIRDHLLQECSLKPEHIQQVQEAIDEIFRTRTEAKKSLRDCLLEGIKSEKSAKSSIGVINQIVGNLSAYASVWNHHNWQN